MDVGHPASAAGPARARNGPGDVASETEDPMATPTAAQRYAQLSGPIEREEYNFRHFRTKHLLKDAQATIRGNGMRPGELAPDFELLRSDGGTLRLSELRGRPVLLHFGSRT